MHVHVSGAVATQGPCPGQRTCSLAGAGPEQQRHACMLSLRYDSDSAALQASPSQRTTWAWAARWWC
jgi:hypothetical protein